MNNEKQLQKKLFKYLSLEDRYMHLYQLPTVFDNTNRTSLSLIDSFIEKEFYDLIYELIHNYPDFLENKIYDSNFISFIVNFSLPFSESLRKSDSKYDDLYKLKSYFYNTLVENCIKKMSYNLKSVFYKFYNCFPKPKLIIAKKNKPLKNLFNNFKKLLKIKEIQKEDLEKAFDFYYTRLEVQNDEELENYILRYIKYKLVFISKEIMMYRVNLIEDPNSEYHFLKDKLSMDNWGEYMKIRDMQYPDDDFVVSTFEKLMSVLEQILFYDKLEELFDINNFTKNNFQKGEVLTNE